VSTVLEGVNEAEKRREELEDLSGATATLEANSGPTVWDFPA